MKARKIAAVLATVAAAVALTACSPLHSGTVTGKEYGPPYTTTILTCYIWGKAGCTMWAPVTSYHPATWALDLRNGKNAGQVDVDEQTYNRVKVGDQWSDGTK